MVERLLGTGRAWEGRREGERDSVRKEKGKGERERERKKIWCLYIVLCIPTVIIIHQKS